MKNKIVIYSTATIIAGSIFLLISCRKSSANYNQESTRNSPSVSILANESEKVNYYNNALSSYNDVDENEWIYGTWRCSTPYGTIEIIVQDNGRMYDGIEERWCNYTIEGDRIIEQLNHGISSYNIDRANKRFDCGEPGYWFTKVK